MKFLALTTPHENTADKEAMAENWECLRKERPERVFNLPEGVKLLEGGSVFGRFGMAFIYEAPNERAAREFLSEYKRYCKVETFLMGPCGWCERTKEKSKGSH